MPNRAPREQSVARAVTLFAVTGFIVVALLGFASVSVLRNFANNEAVRDAVELADLAGQSIVEPAVRNGLLIGDPAARQRVGKAIDAYVLHDPVVRVKIWSENGTIIWSDAGQLVGSRFDLRGDELEALERGTAVADVSDLDEPENRYERTYGKLVEVSKGIRAPNGERLLFETYQRSSLIEASGKQIWRHFLPALLGALFALELIQIPLAYVLARRLRDRQRERSALLERAIDASESERRSIAAALHDGPVQQLAGVAFSLAATARRVGTTDGLRSTLEEAASQTRSTIRSLRSTLVELYPATLERSGLEAAVEDLLGPLRDDGVRTSFDLPLELALTTDQEAMLFRAAREAIQNVRKHARASEVSVRVLRDPDRVILAVRDDGVGFDPADTARNGHFGLKLLGDLAADAGGRLDFDSIPGRGTTVRLEVPA